MSELGGLDRHPRIRAQEEILDRPDEHRTFDAEPDRVPHAATSFRHGTLAPVEVPFRDELADAVLQLLWIDPLVVHSFCGTDIHHEPEAFLHGVSEIDFTPVSAELGDDIVCVDDEELGDFLGSEVVTRELVHQRTELILGENGHG